MQQQQRVGEGAAGLGLLGQTPPGGQQRGARHATCEQDAGEGSIGSEPGRGKATSLQAIQAAQQQPLEQSASGHHRKPGGWPETRRQGLPQAAQPARPAVLLQCQEAFQHNRHQMDVLMAIDGQGSGWAYRLKGRDLGLDLEQQLPLQPPAPGQGAGQQRSQQQAPKTCRQMTVTIEQQGNEGRLGQGWPLRQAEVEAEIQSWAIAQAGEGIRQGRPIHQQAGPLEAATVIQPKDRLVHGAIEAEVIGVAAGRGEGSHAGHGLALRRMAGGQLPDHQIHRRRGEHQQQHAQGAAGPPPQHRWQRQAERQVHPHLQQQPTASETTPTGLAMKGEPGMGQVAPEGGGDKTGEIGQGQRKA